MIMAIVLLVFAIYLLLGFVFALVFVIRGITVVDPAAEGAGVVVRIMLLPASTLLWPYLLICWLKAR